jgi:uncharacterized protein (TIRG00374 family)
MDIVEAPPKKRREFPKWLAPAVGYTISAVSLVWVFSKFPYAQLGDHLRTMDWTLVAIAIALEVAVYFFDAWRWAVLLEPVGAPPFGVCLQSVFVGLFANDVLPARAGELIRCFLLSYETKVPLSLAFTSDVILRIMDGLWIVLLYLAITFQISTHVIVNRVMWGFGGTVVVIALLILFVLFHRQHAHTFVKNTSWAARFVHLLEEVHRLGQWRELGSAMAITGFYWLAQALAVWALFGADAFDLGLTAAAFLLIVKAIGTLIPNAPANVGAYQAATMYALGLMFVERPNAQIFAEIMFWFLTLPLAVGGAIAIAVTGLDITDLHRHAREAHAARRPRHPGQPEPNANPS